MSKRRHHAENLLTLAFIVAAFGAPVALLLWIAPSTALAWVTGAAVCLALITLAVRRLRRHRRAPRAACPACGYSWIGLPDAGACPECGVEFQTVSRASPSASGSG